MDQDLHSKIINGFERISEVMKSLIWEKAKSYGISPIQIQILIFISQHKQELCTVSHLAKEFHLTKPTISDAVRILLKKDLALKNSATTDSRSYTLELTNSGKELVKELDLYAQPIRMEMEKIPQGKLLELFSTIYKLIDKLNQSGIITVQRNCYSCRFYKKKGNSNYCQLLEKPLLHHEVRLDCPEHEAIS